ncbi:MAG TPA: DUF58 domain-containing protein [Jatrophihabitans sp.]|jgi:uncharacterized protein (DUF58 family)|uniref:DUF58 domain-containing protein n=1 Tax=Jatrophihabitans sp. TaxID=1932789 RepID=UPI002E005604|nr:DUF58 domain-containing protein [Jatrophihabitans sp.]
MTRFGLASLLGGIASLVLGLSLDWLAFDLVGLGLLAVVVIGFATVTRPSNLVIAREIQPPRVPKGSPAIAFLTFANRGRRTIPVAVATQPFGAQRVRTVIPKLRGGERGTRAYRLPTRQRGIFDVDPIEVTRRDSFELFRRSRKHAEAELIWVYPRILGFKALPTGQTRHLEGPSSDTSPQGNITFHRLREYVPGDDLRLVHWRSSARAGRLLVKHNVDTSQPYTVVLFDKRPSLYTEESFEQAVDVAASVVVASAGNKAPVELRLSDGTLLGGPRIRDSTPLIDHLTGVVSDPDGSLQTQLLALRRTRGGTSLVVVTGEIDPEDLPYVAALRRRFDRLVVISIDPDSKVVPDFPRVRVIVAADADDACAAWNLAVPR